MSADPIPPDPSTALAQASCPLLQPQNTTLDILKALQLSSAARWEKRRDYEWKLSYAFWTALAGFIATVLFGKDANFPNVDEKVMKVLLGSFFVCHAYYLLNMVDRTLGDLHAQSVIEKTMNELGPKIKEDIFSAGVDGKHWIAQRYGVWSQLFITATLSVAAFWFSTHRSVPVQVAPAVPVTSSAPQVVSPSAPAYQISSRKHAVHH